MWKVIKKIVMDEKMKNDIWHTIDANVEALSGDECKMLEGALSDDYIELPSLKALREIVDVAKSIIFPGYYGTGLRSVAAIKYHTGVALERLFYLLKCQVATGLSFEPELSGGDPHEITTKFINRLPYIKEMLHSDVEAVLKGDPAAKSRTEIIFCYPGITAITHHRIAHELLKLGLNTIARIISEMSHSKTGIDIHPGATIGRSFCIDHGTGVVIGETCIIGENVKLYQGVTLGAKSFVKDDSGNILNLPRHPIIGDNVTIYSNTSILGRITIGQDSIIGGNIWLTYSVPEKSRIVQPKATYPLLTEEV